MPTGGGMPAGGCAPKSGLGLIGMIVLFVLFLAFSGGLGGGGGTGGGGGGGNSASNGRPDLVGVSGVNRNDLSAGEQQALVQFADALALDVNSYWEVQYPQTYGQNYRAPDFFPFNPEAPQRTLSCGQRLPASVLKSNAIYCPAGDYITWDEFYLFPNLSKNFGNAAVGVVLAHEWGHAIQGPERARVSGNSTIFKELQADCFAGAWVASVQAGESTVVEPFNRQELDGAVAGFLLLRDPPGTNPLAQGAHGTAFDRIGSFEDGLINGPDYCASYREGSGDKPRITPLVFTEDDENGGNMSYEIALDVVINANNDFYSDDLLRVLGEEQLGLDAFSSSNGGAPSCPGATTRSHGPIFYCPATTSISWDQDELQRIHAGIGDFAVSQLFAHEYGHAMVDILGLNVSGAQLEEVADCFAGAWSGAVNDGVILVPDPLNRASSVPLQLSADDLDEGLATMLRLRHPAAGADRSGDADLFSRTRAFQIGFFSGQDACRG